MSDSHEPQTLDELFNIAVKASSRQAAMKVAQKHAPVKKLQKEPGAIEPRKLYTDASHWIKGHGIAIIHKPTNTLLGNFQEWIHTSEPDTRRLIRVDTPIRVDCVEEIDSTLFWQPKIWEHSQRNAELLVSIPIELEFPAVASVSWGLNVTATTASFNMIISARLVEQCVFTDGSQLLMLPAGVNVLPVMTLKSKLELRAAIAQTQGEPS